MFRPEHGRLGEQAGGNANHFSATLERSTFLGSHVEYRLRMADNLLVVRAMHGEPFGAGASVQLNVDASCTRVFAIE
jgi:ABC-type Fe3+/spermidine/putrescine transport system ATPase subunit